MPVYVDDMEAPFGRMLMCHMIADTQAELFAMVDRIEVRRKWIQYPGTPREHFDISKSKKELAIRYGAIPVTWRQLAAMSRRKQVEGIFGHPDRSEEWLRQHTDKRRLKSV